MLIFFSLLACFIGLWIYIFVGYNNHMDNPNKCFIRINKDIIRGNRDTVFTALLSLRETNYVDYVEICKYVDTISESYCLMGDSKTPKLHQLDTKGCYLKGTKTIFIEPVADDTPETIENRKEQLLKYGRLSRDYWMSQAGDSSN